MDSVDKLTAYPDLSDRLLRFDAPPCDIPAARAQDWLVALINATLGKTKKIEELFDQAAARRLLGADKTRKGLLGTIPMIGSHNLKFPNANVQLCALAEQVDGVSTAPLLHSRTIRRERYWSGAGNAANASYIRLLAQEALFDGQPSCLMLALAKQEGVLWEAARNLGWDDDEICRLCHGQLYQPLDRPVDRLAKQVLWPRQSGDYVAITPVLPFGLTRELHERLRLLRGDTWRIHTVSTRVGGTQPINAGPFNAERGGRYQHIRALPPRLGVRPEQSLAALSNNASLFRLCRRALLDVGRLQKPTGLGVIPESRHRSAHANAARELIEQVAAPLDELMLALAGLDDALQLAAVQHLPEAERRWLLAEPLSREQREWLAEQLCTVVLAIPKRAGRDKAILADADVAALTEACREYFGGARE